MTYVSVNKYRKWLDKGDNLQRVIAYFEDVVGTPALRVSQEDLDYDPESGLLSFDVFILRSDGKRWVDWNSGEPRKTRMITSVSPPPPWHGEL